jgi:DNA-damage-inducible protein J
VKIGMYANTAHWTRKNQTVTANAVVRARINGGIKEEATAVLAAMGLTPSDAFRILMTKIAKEKALPFDLLIPNKETIAAMKEARKGKLKSFTSIDDLMADLNAND